MRKKFSNFLKENRRDLIKLLLFIGTMVSMIWVTISICSSSLFILNTQYRLCTIYTDIKDLENSRKYNHDMAIMSTGETRRSFQKKADEADSRIPTLYEKRKKIIESNNFYVALAAKNCISIPMIFIGFLPIISILIIWILLIYNYNYIKVIKFEYLICKSVTRAILLVLLLPIIILFLEY